MRRLSSAAAQMIMAPGSHLIWQFSELGNDENTKNSNGGNNTDPKRVLWSYYEVPARLGLYWNYCELIKYRLLNPDLFSQEAVYSLDYTPWTSCRYFNSVNGDKELHLVVNPTVSDRLTYICNFRSKNPGDYMIATQSFNTAPKINYETGEVTLEPGAYVVIASNTIETGIDDIRNDLADVEPTGCEWYTLTGTRVMNPDRGIYIKVVRFADGTSRNLKVVRGVSGR